jgi:glycosyltransferase involved in cell wall biosynthesis
VRIAIDARELVGTPTGVGRYLAQIVAAWESLPGASAHELLFCAPSPVSLPAALRASLRTAPGHGTLWEQRVLPRLIADADVLFAPGYTAPLRARIPVVVTVHDVSFAAHPEWFSWREGLRRRVLTRATARRAARVITVSEFSKREIARHLGIAPAKVDVVYSGVTAWIDHGRTEQPREPRVLYVGSLFNRRHIPELIAGFARLVQRHPDAWLDLVGDNRTRPRVNIEALIAASGAADRIRARSYVGDDELAQLYAQASAFVFLSDYEGFALTPLEALGAGIPVALLDTEVAREIYGDAALYVARLDPDTIADALARLVCDAAERDRLLTAGRTQLARYSWRACAQRTLQVLQAAAGR